ncbi:TMEM175 family protein [Streptacidiphilus carbonis]|uniref:TMEM175 family protein n=1 Tax=Streptacidiphilus carbonis TaxID=105422 RepID=UPI0005A84596|nr:TMEM175 family protein [Streptacidiphilus carbonis]
MNESGRVEAFSDGVFAIAITLLILDVKAPSQSTGKSLAHQLAHQWPQYDAYVVSFLVIGIMWANHHQVFSFVARVDRVLLFLNLLLLMGVSALPWATSVVSGYLDQPKGAELAVALYGGFMVAHALTFQALWWWLTRTGHLFDARVDEVLARGTRARFALGTVVYPILVGLSFVNAVLTLALHGAIAIYYAFNQLRVPIKPQADGDAEAVQPAS